MANRSFAEAADGNLYFGLKTVFRVGLKAILWGYLQVQEKPAPDPYSPVRTASEGGKKVTAKQVLEQVESVLKAKGYRFFEDLEIDGDRQTDHFAAFVKKSFPQLVDELRQQSGGS